MHITLTPMRMDGSLAVAVAGDILTVNGQTLDLSPLPEGALLPRAAVDCPWLASDISRAGGELHLTLILPHGPIPWPAPPGAAAVLHPAPVVVSGDGPVALPVWTPVEEGAP